MSARIGDDSASCGRSDTVCNGPLESDAEYGVRYTLFSGTQSQDYPFFDDAVFRTGRFSVWSAQLNLHLLAQVLTVLCNTCVYILYSHPYIKLHAPIAAIMHATA